jgi:Holliday junction resolvase RusA-like endonuclease
MNVKQYVNAAESLMEHLDSHGLGDVFRDSRQHIEFFLSCLPPKSTHQASLRIMKRRDGTQFVGKFANSKGKGVQNFLLLMLREFKPEKPFEGPLSLSVAWCYDWRSAESKKVRAKGMKWCDTRPDCDNILKLLADCMTQLGFWHDDSQVARLLFEKCWSDRPGIGIEVESLSND